MNMFSNYEYLSESDSPTNINTDPAVVYESIKREFPIKLCNIKGEHIGYSWSVGDIFKLRLSANDKIKVHKDSIVYVETGNAPISSTKGYKGQQAYNTADNRSWTCVGRVEGVYRWVEDEFITYDVNGTTEIEMTTDMTGRTLQVGIYNLRGEWLKSFEVAESNEIYCDIDEDIYKILKSGVYRCVVQIVREDEYILKDKFTILINQ